MGQSSPELVAHNDTLVPPRQADLAARRRLRARYCELDKALPSNRRRDRFDQIEEASLIHALLYGRSVMVFGRVFQAYLSAPVNKGRSYIEALEAFTLLWRRLKHVVDEA